MCVHPVRLGATFSRHVGGSRNILLQMAIVIGQRSTIFWKNDRGAGQFRQPWGSSRTRPSWSWIRRRMSRLGETSLQDARPRGQTRLAHRSHRLAKHLWRLLHPRCASSNLLARDIWSALSCAIVVSVEALGSSSMLTSFYRVGPNNVCSDPAREMPRPIVAAVAYHRVSATQRKSGPQPPDTHICEATRASTRLPAASSAPAAVGFRPAASHAPARRRPWAHTHTHTLHGRWRGVGPSRAHVSAHNFVVLDPHAHFEARDTTQQNRARKARTASRARKARAAFTARAARVKHTAHSVRARPRERSWCPHERGRQAERVAEHSAHMVAAMV